MTPYREILFLRKSSGTNPSNTKHENVSRIRFIVCNQGIVVLI